MAETVDQIEAEIDRSRRRLGSSLEELERRVDEAIDWRARFGRARGRFSASCVLPVSCWARSRRGRRSARPCWPHRGARPTRARSTRFHGRDQVLDWWDDVATALLGVAAGSVKDYVAARVPGFADEFDRAARRQRGGGSSLS